MAWAYESQKLLVYHKDRFEKMKNRPGDCVSTDGDTKEMDIKTFFPKFNRAGLIFWFYLAILM